jgi:DNA excision repair protein ERCC-4
MKDGDAMRCDAIDLGCSGLSVSAPRAGPFIPRDSASTTHVSPRITHLTMADEEPVPGESSGPPVRLSLPLAFQQEIFHELRDDDLLLILARGLGLLRLVANLLHSYDAAGHNLVIVVGAEDRENDWIGEALAEHAAVSGSPKCRGMQLVNTDMTNVGTREKMYKRGGICSITSRILIVDFLSGLLDPASVTGLMVLHADRIAATSLEAFIVRIYRQKNKQGFLKAFSDQPEPFTTGFQPLTNILRNLFLRKPILYPRFHVTVAKSLEGRRKAEVIELEVPMTDAMRDIQNAVLECVEVSISELKKMNSGIIEMDDFNMDSALHRSFDSIVRRQLDPVWHRVSFRTRMIVRDLTMLRTILHSLLTLNAVDFNKYLDTVLAASQPPPTSSRKDVSPWLFLDAAHTLFDQAKRRVYTGKITDGPVAVAEQNGLHPVLEELPKWALLAEILEEIDRDMYFNPRPQDESSGSILIMCGDHGTCRQLREYLQTMRIEVQGDRQGPGDADGLPSETKPSAKYMMMRKLRSYLFWKREFARVSSSMFAANEKEINGTSKNFGGQAHRGRGPPNKRRRMRGGGAAAAAAGSARTANGAVSVAGDKDSHIQALMQELGRNDMADENAAAAKMDLGADPLDDMEDYYELYDMKDLVLIHPYDGDMDDHLLEEVKPRYVIMYEPDAAFIRRIEVYRSSHSHRQIRVYFMYYGGSVEEQRYLSTVRREKDSFAKLIRERGNMAMTFTHDAADVSDPQEAFLRTVNTRIAGGGRLTATAEPPRVVVDVREFRSSLPSLLHGRHMVVVPCMLTVGDYILTPEICVERKSVSDLISSFNNGRLYHQAETMLQHYRTPMLLIEFDAQKAFTLEPFADLSSALGTGAAAATVGPDLQSKLVLLTLAFPRLRIIWSSSPYQTAEIFDDLKHKQPEPNPLDAVRVGLETGEEPESRTFNPTPQDMLRCVPGVDGKVLTKLVLELENVRAVANAGEDVVAEMVGRETARRIRAFFDRSVWGEDEGG